MDVVVIFAFFFFAYNLRRAGAQTHKRSVRIIRHFMACVALCIGTSVRFRIRAKPLRFGLHIAICMAMGNPQLHCVHTTQFVVVVAVVVGVSLTPYACLVRLFKIHLTGGGLCVAIHNQITFGVSLF